MSRQRKLKSQQRPQLLVRHGRGAVPVTTDHVGVDHQCVEHRLFHRLNDGSIEVVDPPPRYELQGAEFVVAYIADRECTDETGRRRGGEGQEDIAGEVTAGGAGSGQPQWNASRESFALAGEQGRVGGDDRDDRPDARWPSEIVGEPVLSQRIVIGEVRADVVPGDG